MKIITIFKFLVGIPVACLALLSFFLIEDVSLGIVSFAFSCDSKIDHEQYRICARNIQSGNDEIDPPELHWIASIELGKRLLPGIYYRIGELGENKLTFETHASAQLQVRISNPSIVVVLVDSKEVAKFKVPEDFVDR